MAKKEIPIESVKKADVHQAAAPAKKKKPKGREAWDKDYSAHKKFSKIKKGEK